MISTRHLIPAAMLLLLLLTPRSSAQAQISIGPKVGINSANALIHVDEERNPPTTSRQGFIVGGVLEFGLSGALSIQIEPQYARKGYRLDDTFALQSFTVIANLDYLEMPMLVKATWKTGGFRAFAFAGPNIGFRVSAQLSSVMPNSVETRHVEYSTKDIDVALDLGGGIGFDMGKNTTFYTDARLSHGLTNISTRRDSYHSRDFKVAVGLQFAME